MYIPNLRSIIPNARIISFVDRDMFVQYRGGGIGHVLTRRSATTREEDFNNGNPEEQNPPDAAEAGNDEAELDMEAEEAELVDWGYLNEAGNAIVDREGERDDDGDAGALEDEYGEEGYAPL